MLPKLSRRASGYAQHSKVLELACFWYLQLSSYRQRGRCSRAHPCPCAQKGMRLRALALLWLQQQQGLLEAPSVYPVPRQWQHDVSKPESLVVQYMLKSLPP